MKHLQLTTSVLCMAALVACNNDKDDTPQLAASDEITIDANVGQMSEKKALKLGTRFDAGDEISVYAWTGSASEIPAVLQVNNSINTLGDNGNWTANPKMLWKDGQSKHYFLGVYPQKAITDFVTDAYALNTADQEVSDVLVATNLTGIQYRSTAIPLKFTHVMARLDVNVKVANFAETPTEVKIKIKAKTSATINYLTKKVTATGEDAEIILPLAKNTADGYLFSYSSIMIPQDGFDKVIITVGDQSFSYSRSKDITLKSGYYTTLNLTLRRNEITVGDVSIVDWNTGESIDGDAFLDDEGSTGDGVFTTDSTICLDNSNVTHTVIFDWYGVEDQIVAHGARAVQPPCMIRWGYVLKKWKNGDNVYDFSSEVTSDLLLSAVWEKMTATTTIDLGLTSGNLWTALNLGAVMPWPGDYYAWGETSTKSIFTWSTYRYGTDKNSMTKYCTESKYGKDGFTDGLTTLEESDDAATAVLGSDFAIPTMEEWKELGDECYWVWTSNYLSLGMYGYIVYKAKTAEDKGVKVTAERTAKPEYMPYDTHIFLPTTGFREKGKNINCQVDPYGGLGHYWASTSHSYSNLTSYEGDELYFDNLHVFPNFSGIYRFYGLNVRAVKRPTISTE